MWLFMPFGFYSIVQKPGETDLTVRARAPADLDYLREHYVPSLGPTQVSPGHDYPCRARATHAGLAAGLSKIALDLHYSNVKSETGRQSGADRARIYQEVHHASVALSEIHPKSAVSTSTSRPKPAPAPSGLAAYGGVVFDGEGRVLLVEPTNHNDNTVWTFPKGASHRGETPEETALREVREESGIIARVAAPLPGSYKGVNGHTSYFLMALESDKGDFDREETQSVAWVTPDDVRQRLALTRKRSARERDLKVLESALAARSEARRAGADIAGRKSESALPHDYAPELKAAVEAAQAAGEMIRSEFHRPGGPRGSGNKADIDAEAEQVIRDHLDKSFKAYGIIGEELQNRPSNDSQQHLWLVDPQDGTRAFLKGHRGTAVSIGLLRAGVPVLGVVYAPTAPDDSGDLFAWAEGCGPLLRNGRPIERTWPTELSSNCTVIVSQDADNNSLANAQVVEPARFRAVPSVAYRLALVAAGEGDAGVSLAGPGNYDVAGGHALLRGVGGKLYTLSGKEVVYKADGGASVGNCIGGAPGLAKELAARKWSVVMSRSGDETTPYRLSRPKSGFHVSSADLLARAQGCLLGQLAGDALGSLVEFNSSKSIAAKYPAGVRRMADGGSWNTIAGQPTDDSELALMLARSLVKEGKFDAEAVAKAYVFWKNSPPFDIGGTTSQALTAAADARGESALDAAIRAASTASQANGALMRVSPLGIFGHAVPPEQLGEWARQDARITHPHAICRDCSAVFAVAVARAIAHGEPAKAVFDFALDWATSAKLDSAVLSRMEAARRESAVCDGENQGWVLLALQNAFFELLHAQSPEEGIVRSISSGGDTDTNAAIAGALLGAVHGRAAIPRQWQDRLLTCRPLRSLPGVHRPRAAAFWPVDAFVLAELLLKTGENN